MYVLNRLVPSRSLTSPVFSDGPDKGIIPLTCSELFVRVEHKKAEDHNVNFTVEVSYIEVCLVHSSDIRFHNMMITDIQRKSARPPEPQKYGELACSRAPKSGTIRRGSFQVGREQLR